MVAEGLGVSIVPTLGLQPELRGVLIKPLVPRVHRTLALGHLPDPSPAARAFLAQVAQAGPEHVGIPAGFG